VVAFRRRRQQRTGLLIAGVVLLALSPLVRRLMGEVK
jgi:hypothetical protein